MQSETAPHLPEEFGHCRAAHCANDGSRCFYVDRRGLRCPTHWCADHAESVAGVVHCRRHAGTLAAMGPTSHPLVHRPALDNRAASLTGWVAQHLDEHIRSLLACLQRSDEMLVTDASISACDDGHTALRWLRGWSLVSPDGVSMRVVVEISEADDAMVCVAVGRNTVFRGVPPWIAWHRMGLHVPEPVDSAGRKVFYDKVKGAVADELVRRRLRVPPPLSTYEPDHLSDLS